MSNQHFSKSVEASPNIYLFLDCDVIHRQSRHPLVCLSKLTILRAASTHYPVLRNFLHAVYRAIKSHIQVTGIDSALRDGHFHSMMEITKTVEFDADTESRYEHILTQQQTFRNPNLESHLLITHVEVIKQFEKEIDDFPEYVCCQL